MKYSELFKGQSLEFVKDFVQKIACEGCGGDPGKDWVQMVILLVAVLIVVFLLYKLLWVVWKIVSDWVKIWKW